MNISDITKRVLSENQPLQITFCKKFRNYLVYGLQPRADMSPDDPNFLVDSYAIMDINTGMPVYKSLFTKEFEDYFTQAVDVDLNGSEELKHYGVLGMKWGVRKDGKPQGYQGSGKNHSAANSFNRQKKRVSSGKAQLSKSKLQGRSLSYAEQEIITDAASLALVLAMCGVVRAVRTSRALNLNKADRQNITTLDDIPKKKKNTTEDADMKAVNPKYKDSNGKVQKQYAYNCMNCTTVYDLRRRGYDVTANGREMGLPTKAVKNFYVPKPKIEKASGVNGTGTYRKLEPKLNALPNGSRGNFMVTGDICHSIAFEKTKGKVTLLDCQTGEKSDNVSDYLKKYSITKVSFARTDNCEPNVNFIAETIDPSSLKKAG